MKTLQVLTLARSSRIDKADYDGQREAYFADCATYRYHRGATNKAYRQIGNIDVPDNLLEKYRFYDGGYCAGQYYSMDIVRSAHRLFAEMLKAGGGGV